MLPTSVMGCIPTVPQNTVQYSTKLAAKRISPDARPSTMITNALTLAAVPSPNLAYGALTSRS